MIWGGGKTSKGKFFLFDIFTQIFIYCPKNYTFPLRRNKFFSSRKVMIFQKKLNTVIIPKFLFAEADMIKLTFQINI